MTKISRFAGLLEIDSPAFEDHSPIFVPREDPFTIRFRVRQIVWLSLERAIPIRDEALWDNLSFTRGVLKNSSAWTGKFRSSMTEIDVSDALLIRRIIERQSGGDARSYALDSDDKKHLRTRRIRETGKDEFPRPIPKGDASTSSAEPAPRDSILIQALLAMTGERMGFQVWIPKSDRSRVLEQWEPGPDTLLDTLPLNYDEDTLNTVEQIDVLWLRQRTIVRAFEVEHTTSIYSGILRMADLLALQPNLDIKAHIVAPSDRRDKVMHEITRPAFSQLGNRRLSNTCTYLSYEELSSLAGQRHLEHMSESVVSGNRKLHIRDRRKLRSRGPVICRTPPWWRSHMDGAGRCTNGARGCC